MLTAENIATGTAHDVWSVNVEEEYHEEGSDRQASGTSGTGRDAPIVPRRRVEAPASAPAAASASASASAAASAPAGDQKV